MAAIRTHRNARLGVGPHAAQRDRVLSRINAASIMIIAGATLGTGVIAAEVAGASFHGTVKSHATSSSTSQSGGTTVPGYDDDGGFTPAPVAPQPSQYQPPVASSGGS